MKEKYIDTGQVRFVYRHFPLQSHPLAPKAAEAADCAGQQGKYWEMVDELFATQQTWGQQGADPAPAFKKMAQEFGLDTARFNACLDNGEAAISVQADSMAARAAGVSATPYFFVNDLPIRGGLSAEAFGQVIDYAAAGGPTPEIVPDAGDYHLRGNMQTARAITVAFVDYASPESAKHARQVLPQLVNTYVDKGQLVYVLHPWGGGPDSPSTQGAIAAECAGEQGQYWAMHDRLFAEQDKWIQAGDAESLFLGYAQDLGLNAAGFEACLDSEAAALRVQAGNVVGTLYGVPGAPVFLFNNGQGLQGSPTFDEFKAQIDSILQR